MENNTKKILYEMGKSLGINKEDIDTAQRTKKYGKILYVILFLISAPMICDLYAMYHCFDLSEIFRFF